MDLPNPDNLRVVFYPDPVLRVRCTPVEAFEPNLKTLADRMLVLMREANGVGLAAPQVAVPIRLFVCNATGRPEDDLICINPRFVELSGAEEREEGCLSLPGVCVVRRRALRAVLQAQDVEGRPFEVVGEEMLARVWQHESDHLDGRLITDNMSSSDEIANRRIIRQLESEYAGPRRR